MARISLTSNTNSLIAQRNLARATESLSNTFQRLSSGLRINRASDDAAGLAIVSSLNTTQRVFSKGVQNLNDGISLLSVADSALGSLTDIVIRLKELAEQSANGTLGYRQRKALDTEAQQLSKEYCRLVRSTAFNGIQVFDGSTGRLSLQAGFGTSGAIGSTLGGAVGTGRFGDVPTSIVLNSSATDVAAGDLNGDGIQDLVSYDGSINVSFGNGDGSFRSPTTYASSAADLTLCDLNNDGRLDIIGIAGVAGTVSLGVRLNRGDGTFGAVSTITAAGDTYARLAVGDLNNDGNLDIALHTYFTSTGHDGIAIRLGNGDGTFQTAVTSPRGGNTNYMAVGDDVLGPIRLADLDNDGVLDLVTGGWGDIGEAPTVAVQLGRGDGTFKTATSFTVGVGTAIASLALGDLNNDGIQDLFVGGFNGWSHGGTAVRLGQGSGTFSSVETIYGGAATLGLGDFNGDGLLDMVTSNFGGTLETYLGNGKGALSLSQGISEPASSTALALADLDRDGVLDLVTGSYVSNEVYVYKGASTSGAAPLLNFSLKTRADALQSFGMLDTKLTQLSAQRGIIGAFQSRASFAMVTLAATREAYITAGSRIKDADIAQESASMIRLQIVQQAASSVLAQANEQPALVLSLLSG